MTQWRHSGLTLKQYCEQHQLNFSSFRDWIADSKKIPRDLTPSLPTLLVSVR
ncbi:IS66 family insertion sequence element accessory protein TnpA [Xenorhabdus budapestensis]|uniref:IS66 family insertion sequence element accessory protein TnpA n=1 Tax=Xenorhabdus budapestensis TaxID=290110 RepID=UPI003A8B762F